MAEPQRNALSAEKSRLRLAAAATRDAVPAERRGSAAIAIRDRVLEAGPVMTGAIVSFYWPMRSEIDPSPLAEALADRGHVLALPVVVDRAAALIFRRWRPGDELRAGGFGTQVPHEAAGIVRPDTLLVPLLAFDRRGFRLGYGGGFYDRTLAALRAAGGAVAIGLAYAEQEIDAVPVGPSDARLDAVVTDREMIVTSPLPQAPGKNDAHR
jgi:5-formyltetrahydrofolate cyclo-ligase